MSTITQPRPIDIETKYGENLRGVIRVDMKAGTATLTTEKGKGWRGAHSKWMQRARPGSELLLDYVALDHTTHNESVATRWRLR